MQEFEVIREYKKVIKYAFEQYNKYSYICCLNLCTFEDEHYIGTVQNFKLSEENKCMYFLFTRGYYVSKYPKKIPFNIIEHFSIFPDSSMSDENLLLPFQTTYFHENLLTRLRELN